MKPQVSPRVQCERQVEAEAPPSRLQLPECRRGAGSHLGGWSAVADVCNSNCSPLPSWHPHPWPPCTHGHVDGAPPTHPRPRAWTVPAMLTRSDGVNDTVPVRVWISGGLAPERCTAARSTGPIGLLDDETCAAQASAPTCRWSASRRWRQQMESGRGEQRLPVEPGQPAPLRGRVADGYGPCHGELGLRGTQRTSREFRQLRDFRKLP